MKATSQRNSKGDLSYTFELESEGLSCVPVMKVACHDQRSSEGDLCDTFELESEGL